MNKEMLAKCEGHVVRIRPMARRFSGQDELDTIDDDWMIRRVDLSRKTVEIINLRSEYCPILGLDHVHSYTSDPMSDRGEQKHGFLQLNVQVFMTDRGPKIEPLPRGGLVPEHHTRRAEPTSNTGSVRREVQDARIAEELRRMEERSRAQEEFNEIDKLRHVGFALREKLRREAPGLARPSGSTALATIPPVNHEHFEVSEWLGAVANALRRMKPPELAKYFERCSPSLAPLERLECLIERLETVLTQIQTRIVL